MKFDPIMKPEQSGPGIAHDIRGLMSCAMLAAEQLNYHDDPRVVRHATRIIDAVERVVAVCKAELARDRARRAETEHHQTQCVERLLRQIFNLISLDTAEARRPIDFRCKVGSGVQVECNSSALFRILFNLIGNAAAAITKKGGSSIEVSVLQVGDWVMFDITDDGPGLPDDVLESLFPRLGEMPIRQGRLGRGLSMAANLASGMGGQLLLSATSESGTSFRLSIPTHIDPMPGSLIVSGHSSSRRFDVSGAVVDSDVIRPISQQSSATSKTMAGTQPHSL